MLVGGSSGEMHVQIRWCYLDPRCGVPVHPCGTFVLLAVAQVSDIKDSDSAIVRRVLNPLELHRLLAHCVDHGPDQWYHITYGNQRRRVEGRVDVILWRCGGCAVAAQRGRLGRRWWLVVLRVWNDW